MSYQDWGSQQVESSRETMTTSSRSSGSHSCCRCGLGFATSNQLVAHMREEQSSFVEQPRGKDHSKLFNLVDKPNDHYISNNLPYATCPFCQRDCFTKKKLMNHLTLEHKDDDKDERDDGEPEFKVIRLEGEQKQQLLDTLKTVKTEGGQSQAPTLQSVLRSIDSSDSKSLTLSNDIKVVDITQKNATATIKFPERRYKCFWCETSFRKRGKLMDHIDMFHKANKQQCEVEAELLHGTGNQLSDEKNATSSLSFDAPVKQLMASPPVPSYSRNATGNNNSNTSQPAFPERIPATAATGPPVCTFQLVGSMLEKPLTPTKNAPEENSFQFYNGRKSNPLLQMQNFRRSSNPNLQSGQNILSSGYHNMASSFPTMMPPSSLSPQDRRSMHPLLFGPTASTGTKLSQSPFYSSPRMPFLFPSHDLMMNQHTMMMEQQRSPIPQQYLNSLNMANINLLRKSFSTDGPLDLTKTK